MSEPQDKVDVGSLKDNFLECPVCVEHFNQTNRRPRLLHTCLHAFCTQCLQQLLAKEGKGQITCPLCRKAQRVRGNADTIEVDGLRDKLVEFLQVKHNKKVHCSECLERNEAVSRCQECHSYLCKECDFVHRRHRVSRDHVIVSLGDLIDQPITSFAKGHFCPKHPKQNLEFYCATEEILCCVSCTVLDHKGHDLQQLVEASAARKAELETKLAQVHGHADRLRKYKKQVKCQEKHIEDMRAKSLSDINSMFDHFNAVLDKRKNQLMTDVKQRSAHLLSILQKKMESNDQTLAMMESTGTYFEQAKEKADIVEMLQMYPAINRSLESLIDTPTSLQLGTEQTMLNIRFMPQEASHIETLMTNVGSLSRPTEGILTEILKPQHPENQTACSTQHLETDFSELQAADMYRLQNKGKESGDDSARFVQKDPQELLSYRFELPGGIKVKVCYGNIVKCKLEGIVSAANGELRNFAGVAGAIERACGSELRRECDRYIGHHGPLQVSDVMHTSPGDLIGPRYVLHTVGPDHVPTMDDKCAYQLTRTFLRCLNYSHEKLFINSIAFPFISTGVFGVPIDICIQSFLDALVLFSSAHKTYSTLKEIYLLNTDMEMVQTAIVMLQQHLETDSSELQAAAMYRLQNKGKHSGLYERTSRSDSRDVAGGKIQRSTLLTRDSHQRNSKEDDDRSSTSSYGVTKSRRGHDTGARSRTDLMQRSLPHRQSLGSLEITPRKPTNTGARPKTTPNLGGTEKRTGAGASKSRTGTTGGSYSIINKPMKAGTTLIRATADIKGKSIVSQEILRQGHYGDDDRYMSLPTDLGRTSTLGASKSNDPDDTCCICMDKITDPKKLPCGHTFCTGCIRQAFKVKPACPECGKLYGTVTGNQPKGGKMTHDIDRGNVLPGYEDARGVIVINYDFPGGIQQADHPEPGKRYSGIQRTAYLPYNDEGWEVLKLLYKAFNAGVTFTIGESRTTGRSGVITWNDIHHKTSMTGGTSNYGYPDPDYLMRVKEELALKGVTSST